MPIGLLRTWKESWCHFNVTYLVLKLTTHPQIKCHGRSLRRSSQANFPWMHLPWVPFIGQRYMLSNQDCTSHSIWQSCIISEWLSFENLLEFILSCKEVVTFFHNHDVLKAELKDSFESAKLKALATMAQIQWRKSKDCFNPSWKLIMYWIQLYHSRILYLGQPSRMRSNKILRIF